MPFTVRDPLISTLLFKDSTVYSHLSQPKSLGKFILTTSEMEGLSIIQVYLADNNHLENVIFCCFDEENFSIYQSLLIG